MVPPGDAAHRRDLYVPRMGARVDRVERLLRWRC